MQDLAEAFFPSAISCVLHFSLILTSYSSSTLVCGKDKYYILHRVVYFSLSLCNILWFWSFHHTHVVISIQSIHQIRNRYSPKHHSKPSFFLLYIPFNQSIILTKTTSNPYPARLSACYLSTIVSSTSPFNIKFHIQFQTQKNHLLFPYIIRNLMPSKKKISSLIVIQAKKMEHFLLPCLPVNHFQHVYYNEPFLLYRYIHHDYCCIYLKA